MNILWGFTGVLMGAGAAQALAIVLEKKELAGVIRMSSALGTPQWAQAISTVLSFGSILPLMIVGIVVWTRRKTPYLFISMFGELWMVLFLYLTGRSLLKKENEGRV